MAILQIIMRLVLVSLVFSGLALAPLPRRGDGTSGELQVLRTVPLGLSPTAVAVDGRTERVFVVADDGNYRHPGRVFMLDAASGVLLRTQRAGVFANAVAVDERSTRAFITQAGAVGSRAGVLVLDTTTGAPITTTVLAQRPAGLAIDRGAGHVFVASAGDRSVRTLTL
jgi:DNA-binding beta-propeller fold protein YncE